MTENEAIDALMGAFNEGQEGEPVTAEPTNEPQPNEPKESREEPSKEPATKEAPKSEATPKESTPAVMTPEQQAMLDSMGLGDIGQIREQLAQFQAAQAAAAEQARQQEIFNKNSAEFKRTSLPSNLKSLANLPTKTALCHYLAKITTDGKRSRRQ